MKKFLIGLGVVFLAIIVIFAVFGGFAWMKMSGMMPSVESTVDKFYISFDNGNYDDIYNSMVDEKWQKRDSSDKFSAFMSKILTMCGKEKSHVRGKYGLQYLSDGTYFSIEYATERDKKKTTDDFVFRKNQEDWKLFSYHVDVNQL